MLVTMITRHLKATIVAVGTEITSGQTTNAHATWIASKLDDFGIEPILHIAVPDDERMMTEAFHEAQSNGEFIFITGGLGPTRDDFTRPVVAKWLSEELIFDESSWRDLVDRLTSRRVKVSDSHKSQCYFPNNSKILYNNVGTAHAFYIHKHDCHVWVLPGPTPELHGIWNDHIVDQLSSLREAKSERLLKWRCLGIPESELADVVEQTLHGSGLKTGYRLTTPFVEVKVWIPESAKDTLKWITKLEHVLERWVVVKGDMDLASEFLDRVLNKDSLTLIDDATKGHFFERLMTLYRNKSFPFELRGLISSVPELDSVSFGGTGTTLRVIATDEKTNWWLELKTPTFHKREKLTFESQAKTNPERLGRVIVELSLKALSSWSF
jgi:nicotinamide-nucleotide amidase